MAKATGLGPKPTSQGAGAAGLVTVGEKSARLSGLGDGCACTWAHAEGFHVEEE